MKIQPTMVLHAMRKQRWISHSLDNSTKNDEKRKMELTKFWNNFLNYLLEKSRQEEKGSKTSTPHLYKKTVLDILQNAKNFFPLKDDQLCEIQLNIEKLTMFFDEENMYQTVPEIIKMLIIKNEISAKDYLRGMKLEKDDMELLFEFGKYTIEALIVYVLSTLLNPVEDKLTIKLASLVEQLDFNVRKQALLLKRRRCQIPFSKSDEVHQEKEKENLLKKYPFGAGLVLFMEDRNLIILSKDLGGSIRVNKKRGSYYLSRYWYAYCNFNISLLPIKFNLPMVCKPEDWRSTRKSGQKPRTMSDLSGGYLSGLTGDIYDRYRLLSSGNVHHFYIDISREENYESICRVMNKLQGQAFQINSDWLKFILKNEKLLVDSGYLMPKFLASLNIKEASFLLREFYMKDEIIKKFYSFSELLDLLNKDIQRSSYERLIINLAIAYDGYHFYLPAFLDFRGRIYRCGILHFHERDLARSLIIFADSNSNSKSMDNELFERYITAIAFHYKSFESVNAALMLFSKDFFSKSLDYHIAFAQKAKHPFQFLANLFGKGLNMKRVPIIQDASASAYQIMSYFLLDESLAKRTNLIPSSDGKIQDVYSFMLEELKVFMKTELEMSLSKAVCETLDRKIVKGIFMPIIYGKTLMSTAEDLKKSLSRFITHKECYDVASVCFKFWRTKYQGMESLILLIRHIGWIASARNSPVFYRVPYFTTVQDYMIMDAINIWIYNRLSKKRRQVTLRVLSEKRDSKKTAISTFVNFIHQRDAHIAMSVVDQMLEKGAPIYTVHDNFLTTTEYCHFLPEIYSNVFRQMGPPLSIINEFIYMNLIQPIVKGQSDGFTETKFAREVISREMLQSYLKANIPENISKRMIATWEKRISGILTCYENYTSHVCGQQKQSDNPKDCWLAHEEKWDKFQSQLKSEEGIPYYCVHY
jgi:hypothetical protein